MTGRRYYEFGPFRLDPVRRLLCCQGRAVPLTPKVLHTLLVLVENHGRVVGKEELLKAVWPDTFVEEGNLTQNISTLRKVLGESPGEHAYIETAPKQGYRFVATVMERTAPPRAKWLRPLVWAGLTAAFLGIVAGLVWFSRKRVESPATLNAIPFTSYPGLELYPSFSPDGSQIAFAWDGEKQDNLDVYVKLIGVEGARRLTVDPARDFRPAWSPDGRFIAFLREAGGGNAAVILIPALGGLERKLAVVYPGHFGSYGRAPCLEWTLDGKSVLTPDRAAPDHPSSLFLISVESGEKRRLTSPPESHLGDLSAAISPDGRALAFSRVRSGNFGTLCLVAISSHLTAKQEPRCFAGLDGFGGLRSLRWTADGREIVFSAPLIGTAPPKLWRMALPAGRSSVRDPQRLPIPSDSSSDLAISRDGHRLIYSTLTVDVDVWRLELPDDTRGGRGAGVGPVKLISSTKNDWNAQYSPDGQRIAFMSTRSGRAAVWVANKDGSGATQLTALDAPLTGWPRWNPDGRRLVFDSTLEGQWHVYVINADGGGLRRLTRREGAVASWSRDGQWIYFRSAGQVWKMPAEGGEAVQLTKHGGLAAFESADGKFVYYSKSLPGVTSLWKIPVAGGEETKVLDSVWPLHFTVVDSGIYFVAPEDHGSSVRFLDFQTGKVASIARVDAPIYTGLSVSPDGRFLLYSMGDLAGSDLMLVENFR